MNFKLLLKTLVHLRATQVVHQIKNRVVKAKYVQFAAPKHNTPKLATPIARYEGVKGNTFTFINLTHEFTDWNYVGVGTLFTYNQNYFDFINAEGIERDEACRWIDKFIADRPCITWGMDPYPIALRSINWIKFFSQHPECATKEREDSLYSQLCLLERKLEYHLLANHLLEDAFALTIGGCYFEDEKIKQKGATLLLRELKEQILSDGAHYEQSPMYHCILLDRLLDTYNISRMRELLSFAKLMLGHLDSICYSDDTWPFFNDAALGIAPTPTEIKDYARRLGISWTAIPLASSGYRKLSSASSARNGKAATPQIEAFVDCGNIAATYQPGHTHADTFNYELRIDGQPFVVDTGISTYDKTPRRQYERSTKAHNCVTVNEKDSSEVWGGFRVGKRCKVTIVENEENRIEAYHDGYGKNCHRSFELKDGVFTITDRYDGAAVSRIHLAPGADANRIKVDGATDVRIVDEKISVEYNKFIDIKVVEISFTNQVSYSIS